jgi:hypothetical protein
LGPVAQRNCLYRAAFHFKYSNGRATMTYMVAGINAKQEVEILLNGMHVVHAPITLDRTSSVLTMNLPRKHLLENDMNKVEFINTVNRTNPDADDKWAVSVRSIEEQPLPPPDAKKAEEAFVNANERFKNKGVSPGNMYKAMKFYQQTQDFLELLPAESRPDIYLEARDQVEKIEHDLDRLFSDQNFKAEKLHMYGNKDTAKNIFRVLMLTFPNQADPRHQQAKQGYQALGGSLQEIDY